MTKLIVGGPLAAPEHQRAGHPERPSRVEAAMAGVDDLHLGSDLEAVIGTPATLEQLSRVHSAAYLSELGAFCRSGGGDLDPDTYATPASFDAARAAVGAGLAAVDALAAAGEGVAFVAARPPGHHAPGDRAMGFCLLNNIAVAAAELVARGERVLIVDWDVHHGNGTQEVFWDDPSVLFVSTHQWPLYPGTGAATEVGGPHALGLTVNVPLDPGSTGDSVRAGLDELAAPAIDAFDPTWVLVSAGFDAHRADPMADLALSSGDFADLALVVRDLAPRPGRLALFLEGGYDLEAVRGSVGAVLGALLGVRRAVEQPTSGSGAASVARAVAERAAVLARLSDAGRTTGTGP